MRYLDNIKILPVLLFFSFSFGLHSQERDWEKYLIEDVENINPVYKPVIGFGVGFLSFYGDVNNNIKNPLFGSLAGKVNMHAYVDPKKHFKFNLYVMSTFFGLTPLTVRQRSYSTPNKNFNFQSDFLIFGVNIHYDFDHIIKKTSFVRPFISIGVENVMFSSKADMIGKYYDPNDNQWHQAKYNYWTDGTIRNLPQSSGRQGYFMISDNNYETDIRSDTSINASGNNYSQNTIAIPIEAGLDFSISNRTNIRLGYAFHYTFSDNIDGISTNSKLFKGTSGNDMLGYTYVSLHFDLFSDPKMLRLNKLIAVIEDNDFDVMFGDEDGDMVPDVIDKCLHTPKGVLVDSVGCPYDTDGDGVPDYMDKQPNTPPGAIVDLDGVEISDDVVWANLNLDALPRSEVEMYLSVMNNLGSGTSRRFGKVEIPPKFKSLDLDGDGYISFDEVLKAIDAFFDFDSDLSTQDIYELNDFFFSQ
jgi:hypothetical protein